MPELEAPCVELGSAPQTPSVGPSPSPSEISSNSSLEPQNIRPTPLFRALAMPPPEPEQPPGQEELERRLPGYRRIVIPRDLTLIELLKQSSGVTTDEEVLRIREAKLRVVAERVGLRRLHVLTPRLRELSLDGSAVSSLRDLGIGLVHLKMLSMNRCGLTSLDGVWGLSALRELYAASNKLQDLHPLAALQKLHTLNLSDNPIADSGRLWTLGVCGSLRTLSLRGTPMAEAEDYRVQVTSALPMLMYLDDVPLNGGEEESSLEPELNPPQLSSESESECEADTTATSFTPEPAPEPLPGPSGEPGDSPEPGPGPGAASPPGPGAASPPGARRRPATTACAGARPPRTPLRPRPRTAHAVPTAPETSGKLQVLNTLMDEEWRCSGSRLTSRGAVCGNLARALRRPGSALARNAAVAEEEKIIMEQGIENVKTSRALAAEIPRAPCLADWEKFRQQTGIEIDIDFNERPKQGDAARALDRLERIEKETQERLLEEASTKEGLRGGKGASSVASYEASVSSDCEEWGGPGATDPRLEVDVLFKNIVLSGIASPH